MHAPPDAQTDAASRPPGWGTLVAHWVITSAATAAIALAAPARWEIWAVVGAVAVGAVLRTVPLLGDRHAPLEQLSGRQSVLVVIPAFPIAIGYAVALLGSPWVSSSSAALLCATVFCLGLINLVGHAASRKRRGDAQRD